MSSRKPRSHRYRAAASSSCVKRWGLFGQTRATKAMAERAVRRCTKLKDKKSPEICLATERTEPWDFSGIVIEQNKGDW